MFPFFPYSNFHRLNADWIIKTIKELTERAEAALANVGDWAARIASAEAKADQAAADAAQAAQDATQASQDAAQAAQDAQGAETSAGHAAQSASAAVNLADQAAASASAAQTQASNAATSASAAQTQASNAATSAAQAAASAAQAAQAAEPSVSNYNITFAYPATGGQDITMPDFRDVLADITDEKEIVFNLTFEGDGQGVIDGTARVAGVFANAEQTHIWVYLQVEHTLYAISWFYQGYGTTVYSVYDQTDHNVPPVGAANNGKVLTSHGSYYSWSDAPGPLTVTISGSSWTGADWSTMVNNLTRIVVVFPTGHKVIPLTLVPGNTQADDFLYCRDFQTSTIYRVYGDGHVTQS